MTSLAGYDVLADEYYDASHKTSRNFDQTSAEALKDTGTALPAEGLVLEVGAGRGRAGEFLGTGGHRVIQLDNSAKMLTIEPREPCLLRILHRAEELPFLEQTFSAVVAFLCDPFLGLDFLAEAYRVLREGGLFVATTPAYEWGAPLREQLNIGSATTRFFTRSGTVLAPSVLVKREQLARMAETAGFDRRRLHVTAHRLPADASPISPDISAPAQKIGCDVHELDILYRLVASK